MAVMTKEQYRARFGADPEEHIRINDAISTAGMVPGGAPSGAGGDEPGLGTSVARGVKQGVTLGFGDELAGALESAFTQKTYRQARDEARAKDKAAREAHPIGFGLGQVLGGVGSAVAAPGLSLAKLGTGAAAAVARGAATGIAVGAGESEAEDVKGIVQDAAKTGLVGGAVGAIGHGLSRVLGGPKGIVAGAPERADKNLISDIGDRALPKTRAKIAERSDDVVDTARATGLDKLARKPEQLFEAGKELRQVRGKEIGSVYEGIDDAQGAVLEQAKTRLQAATNEGKIARDAVSEYISAVDEATGGISLSRLVRQTSKAIKGASPEDAALMRQSLSNLERTAEKGIANPPIPIAKIMAEPQLAAANGDAIERHIATTLKRRSDIGSMEMFTRLRGVAAKAPDRVAAATSEVAEARDVPLAGLTAAIRAVGRHYKSTGNHAAYKAILREADGLQELWGKRGFIKAADVHQYVSGLGDRTFEGVSISGGKRITGDIWGAAKGVLEKHVEAVAKKRPGVEGLERIRDLNKQYGALSLIEQAAKKRAQLDQFRPTGLRQIAGEGHSVIAGGIAAASMNPLPLLLTRPALDAAAGIGRRATESLAALVRAARAGQPVAQLAQRALEAGAPRGTVEAILSTTATSGALDEVGGG